MAFKGSLGESEPQQVGPFRLLGRLGTGGMGVVYLGESETTGQAAVKVVRQDLADDPNFRSRFKREVANAKRVSGSYTARLIDADVQGDPPWLATEFIEGPTLHEAVTSGERFEGEMLRALAVGLAEALRAIHTTGIVHRDLKPANIILAADGPRVVDFGIARALDATAMTHTGTTLGSPAFMAPEQIEGGPQTPAIDVFTWAGTLVFAATGEGPFGAGEPQGVMYRVMNQPPRLDGVDPELVPLLRRALDKQPQRRPTITQALNELTGVPDDPAAAATIVSSAWVPPDTQVIYPPPIVVAAQADPPRGGRRWLMTLGLLVLVLASAAGAAVAMTRAADSGAVDLSKAAITKEVIPDLRGEPVRVAETALRNLGLTPKVEEEADPDIGEGRVIRQSPGPEEAALEGSTVILVVSTGPEQVEVPDLSGQLAFPAAARLGELDLDVSTSEIPSDVVQTGAVVAQNPAGGTTVDVGTTVQLIISTGTPEPTLPVPGAPCDLGTFNDCIDPEGDGVGVYLIGGAQCMAALSPSGQGDLCTDLDGDGYAGYPDSG